MIAFAFLVLALSALSSALPARRATSCSTPSTFTIEEFSIFTPSAGNTHASNLFFIFGDENYHTECTSTITSNPNTPITCADANIQYLWDGTNTLTVGEIYTPCNVTSAAFGVGSLFISLDCIPSEVPFGDGTSCENPVGELTAEFTRDSWSA